ncbi:MAG: DNA topoisomerase [Benniella sp.]|nr:MAG: DNA topoisomerase [Benniella sp.]
MERCRYSATANVSGQEAQKEGSHQPMIIFGHMLTSSSYDDSQKRVTGGRNGYGAKPCNIFQYSVYCGDSRQDQWSHIQPSVQQEHVSHRKAKVAPMKKTEEFTKISFKPDFDRFGMKCINDGLEALLKKCAIDLAGCVKGFMVFLNGERIKIKSFKEYIEMYLPEPVEGQEKPKLMYDSPNPRWEVACMPSSDQFQYVSFANSISTSKGDVHVEYVTKHIVAGLIDIVKKKSKSTNCELSEMFVKDVIKSPIVEGIVNWAAVKDSLALKKTDGSSRRQRLTGIPKLGDAYNAGSKSGRDCALILTEEDSAKSLVMAGSAQIGRDNYGVLHLRGKLFNVRDTSTANVLANKEIGYIKQILMRDQDHDGSHIKGLIINFLDHYVPSLLKIPGFLTEFVTPTARAIKGNGKPNFFTISEFEARKEANDGGQGRTTKYFKGLGVSVNKDVKEYFERRGTSTNSALTTPYKEQIETWIMSTDTISSWIKDFRDGMSTFYMVRFDPQGRIKWYSSAEEIVQAFFESASRSGCRRLKGQGGQGHDYDYLLDMPLRRLSHDEVEEPKKQGDAKNAELKILIDKTVIDLWNEDLDGFTAAWKQRLEKGMEAQQMTTNKSNGKSTVGKRTKSRKSRR